VAVSIDPLILTITASFLIQITVLFVLSYGYFLNRKGNFRKHGLTMSAALILHLVTVFYVMIPSFVYGVIPYYILATPQGLVSIVGITHGILGLMAVGIGVWLVGAWRFKKDVKGCFGRKKFMYPTLGLWIASLAFGIVLYTIFIGTLIAG
jgi:uncharacterized membrane protein YozB (DUF420 family)